MWQEGRQTQFPFRLKKVSGDCSTAYKGYSQQDSNEYLQFLLAQLDDDLNRVKPTVEGDHFKMPYILPPDDVWAEVKLNEDEESLIEVYLDIGLEQN